jgi:DNA-binding transcriptional ArsR family regulator
MDADLSGLPPRLRRLVVQEPNAVPMWPAEVAPEVLRALARGGKNVTRLIHVVPVGSTGEVRLRQLSEWTSGSSETALDMHLAALRAAELSPDERVMIDW